MKSNLQKYDLSGETLLGTFPNRFHDNPGRSSFCEVCMEIQHRKMMSGICKKCGSTFTCRTDHPNKFCSRSCFGKSIVVARHKCLWCDNLVPDNRQKYCSIQCIHEHKAALTVLDVKCDQCGKQFNKHKCHIRTHNFCSKICMSNYSIGKPSVRTKQIGTVQTRKMNGYGNVPWIKVESNKWIQLSRHVWISCRGNIPSGSVVHHKDGDINNNVIDNLELLSRKDHMSVHRKHIRSRLDKLTRLDAENIRELSRRGLTQRVIAEKYGISQGHTWSIVHGYTPNA
jgi:hypothetical protein